MLILTFMGEKMANEFDVRIVLESSLGGRDADPFGSVRGGPDRPFALDCNQNTSQCQCEATKGNCEATNCYSQSIRRTAVKARVLRLA